MRSRKIGVAGVLAMVALSPAAAVFAGSAEGVICSAQPSVLSQNCRNEFTNTLNVPVLELFQGSAQADTTNPCGGSLHPVSLAMNASNLGGPIVFNFDTAIVSNNVSPIIAMHGDVPALSLSATGEIRSYRLEWSWTYQLVSGTHGTIGGEITLGDSRSPVALVKLGEGAGSVLGNVAGGSIGIDFQMNVIHSQNDQDGQWGKAITHLVVSVNVSEFVLEDLNEDGAVNGADLGLLLAAWESDDSVADLNGDGIVDGADLGLLLAAWTG